MNRVACRIVPLLSTALACGNAAPRALSDGSTNNSDSRRSADVHTVTVAVGYADGGCVGGCPPNGEPVPDDTSGIYAACGWGEPSSPRSISVARWDPVTCICARLSLESGGMCGRPGEDGSWCVTGTAFSHEIAECNVGGASGSGATTGSASGTVLLTQGDPWQLTMDVDVNVAATSEFPAHIRFQTHGCWLSCERGCAQTKSELPKTRSLEVHSYCGRYYEIEVTDPMGFYIGGYVWILRIGDARFGDSRNASYHGGTLAFRLSPAAFEALVDGAAVTASFGTDGNMLKEFGFLNKAAVHPG